MIIMLSGYKRSGKDTVANYLVNEYGFTRYGFADPIKEISYILFDWKKEDDEVLKEVIDERYGFSRRQFWQYFGTEWAQYQLPNQFAEFSKKIGRNFWVKKFENLYKSNPNINYVISDYRFPHEYEVLKEYNPKCIQIHRDIVASDCHESEKYINDLHTNYYLKNDCDLIQLERRVKTIMSFIIVDEPCHHTL
ncbi:MAG: hypothetical protein AB7V16_11830 [Vulcanibacillus sp.]